MNSVKEKKNLTYSFPSSIPDCVVGEKRKEKK